MFKYSFNQSFALDFDSCKNDRRIGSMPIVQAIFIISLTNNNANNNNIVNEHQNRWLIMRIGKCVQKQCMEEIWNEMMSSNSNNEWMNDNMSNNTYQYIVNSIQCPISNNTNLCFTNTSWKERVIVWIITENEEYIFENK